MQNGVEYNMLVLPEDSLVDGARAERVVTQVVLKVARDCDLACEGCYMYELADRSWKKQPRFMSLDIVAQTARRIAEHAAAYDLSEVGVVFHGGEPLLAPKDFFARAAELLRGAIYSDTLVRLSVQTNALRLVKYLPTLLDCGIEFGVSLNGGKEANDAQRKFRNGQGSFEQVTANLNTMLRQPKHRRLFRRLLCIPNLEYDPLKVYRDLMSFGPPSMDFLLPHGDWVHRPVGRGPGASFGDTPYADWLIKIFDQWMLDGPQHVRIRTFDSILSLLEGGPSGVETLGLGSAGLLTVNGDGSIEQVDTLRSAKEGAVYTGMHVNTHSFDDALRHPDIRARFLGASVLSPVCQRCPLVKVCGGGYITHRYDESNGFDNPSVYCPDLAKLIGHIRGARVARVTRLMMERAVGQHYNSRAQAKDGFGY